MNPIPRTFQQRLGSLPPAVRQFCAQVDEQQPPPGAQFRHSAPTVKPAAGNLPPVRVVMWDLYGTLLAVGAGDLEASLDQDEQIEQAAAAVIERFALADALVRIAAEPPPVTLRKLYLQGIADAHRASEARGIAHPEVVIEDIWRDILQKGAANGWSAAGEPLTTTAYRCAYLFDTAMQTTTWNPHAAETLARLHAGGVTQGIVSNAQFYTPWHMVRLLRAAPPTADLSADSLFDPSLVQFSYELGYSKPSLDAFATAKSVLAQRGFAPDQVLYVGNDMLNDVWAARQAGWHAAWYVGQSSQVRRRADDPRCRTLQPDAVVGDLIAITALTEG